LLKWYRLFVQVVNSHPSKLRGRSSDFREHGHDENGKAEMIEGRVLPKQIAANTERCRRRVALAVTENGATQIAGGSQAHPLEARLMFGPLEGFSPRVVRCGQVERSVL
jgi:hypothetical protein